MTLYKLCMDIKVLDAARNKLIDDSGLKHKPREAIKYTREMLGSLVEPNESACIQWLVDPVSPPGLQIEESWME